MNDEEFVRLGIEVFKEMQYIDISSPEYSTLCKKMGNLKLHIYQNPNNKFVKYFIEELLNRYIELFFNKNLTDSLYISQPFYRQIQMYRNLPSTTHPSYVSYLFKLLELSSFPHFYPAFLESLQKYKPEVSTHPQLQVIQEFVDQNQNIIHGSKDDYVSLEEEKKLYFQAYKGEYFEELKIFAFLNSIMGQDEARSSFMNKRIGNIGEIYIYEFIKDKNKNCFVSKELKNGFGYDLYFLDDNSVETLIEVKTTTLDAYEDSFGMSENEYRIMQQCENNPYARYIICRVKLDSTLNLSSYTFLTMSDSSTLVDISNSDIQYKKEVVGERIYFKKEIQKIKFFDQP